MARKPARLILTCHLSLCLRIVAIEVLQLGPIWDQLNFRFCGGVEGFGLPESVQGLRVVGAQGIEPWTSPV
jgi:hypothetical protein